MELREETWTLFSQTGTDPGLPTGLLGASVLFRDSPRFPGWLLLEFLAILLSLLDRVEPTQQDCFLLLPVSCQLPRCLKVTKVQVASWECVTLQRGVTLGRRRGERAGGALNERLACSQSSLQHR